MGRRMTSATEHSIPTAQVQVEAAHYFRPEYDHRTRLLSYWQQIHYVRTLASQSVLEIGIGNAFVSDYLRRRGVDVLTLDIDANLYPDCAGSILRLPFQDQAFEMVICCEVLEHLPFEWFRGAARELERVSAQHVVISVPDRTRAYRFDVQIPLLGEIKKLVHVPTLRPREHVFDGQHYWELGKAGYPLRLVTGVLEDAGFDILDSYRLFESPKYHFFLLSKHLRGRAGAEV